MLVLLLAVAAIAPPIVGSLRPADVIVLGCVPFLLKAWWAHRCTLVLAAHEKLFLLFVTWSAIATAIGLATGSDGRGLWSALTMARLLEVVAVYAAARLWPGDRPLLALTAAAIATGLAAWGAVEVLRAVIVYGEPYARAFNEGWFRGESTHVAGMLVILGLLAQENAGSTTRRVGLVASLCGVLVSGSRVALAAVTVTAVRLLAMAGRRGAIAVLVAALALAALAAPATFRNRALHVLDGGTYSGPHVDRFTAWRVAVAEAPAWGAGLGARPSSVYESNYVWVYAETGLPGLILSTLSFLVLLRRSEEDPNAGAAAIALLILSFAANVLLIARIAIPAAILLGIIAARPTPARPR